MTTIDVAIALLAEQQFGVFSRLQVHAKGGNDQLIARRLSSGAWILIHPGVYRLRGFPKSYRQRLWVGHLILEEQAKVSHEAAAHLHTYKGFPRREVIFTLPHGRNPAIQGLRVRQISDLFSFADHLMELHGLSVTTPARTFVDLAGLRHISDIRLRDAFNDAWIRRIVSLDEQHRVLEDLNRPNKPGIKRMLRILAKYDPDAMPPDSEIEQTFIEGCRLYCIEQPEMHADHPGRDVPNGVVDGKFRPSMIIGEVDGRDGHARERDRLRDLHR